MKRSATLLLSLLLSPWLLAQAPPANPAAFPLTVHVLYSRAVVGDTGLSGQQLETVIDGQQVELYSVSKGVLALGDYPAVLSTKVRAPTSRPNSYDLYRGYDLLMPDGKTRTYTVSGLGPAAPNP